VFGLVILVSTCNDSVREVAKPSMMIAHPNKKPLLFTAELWRARHEKKMNRFKKFLESMGEKK
jgi:hypothetical protein